MLGYYIIVWPGCKGKNRGFSEIFRGVPGREKTPEVRADLRRNGSFRDGVVLHDIVPHPLGSGRHGAGAGPGEIDRADKLLVLVRDGDDGHLLRVHGWNLGKH